MGLSSAQFQLKRYPGAGAGLELSNFNAPLRNLGRSQHVQNFTIFINDCPEAGYFFILNKFNEK
jgi:hypothetical protein